MVLWVPGLPSSNLLVRMAGKLIKAMGEFRNIIGEVSRSSSTTKGHRHVPVTSGSRLPLIQASVYASSSLNHPVVPAAINHTLLLRL